MTKYFTKICCITFLPKFFHNEKMWGKHSKFSEIGLNVLYKLWKKKNDQKTPQKAPNETWGESSAKWKKTKNCCKKKLIKNMLNKYKHRILNKYKLIKKSDVYILIILYITFSKIFLNICIICVVNFKASFDTLGHITMLAKIKSFFALPNKVTSMTSFLPSTKLRCFRDEVLFC